MHWELSATQETRMASRAYRYIWRGYFLCERNYSFLNIHVYSRDYTKIKTDLLVPEVQRDVKNGSVLTRSINNATELRLFF